jgi:3-hydroxybutyryl-CoA dehydrogenase
MTDRVSARIAAVLGAGLLGAAIAAEYADAGYRVRITTSPRTKGPDAVARVVRLAQSGETDVAWCPTTAEAVADADVVVESLPEDLLTKQEELKVAQRTAPSALLCTNTSSLRISEIAEALDDPSRFIGTHYLNPPSAFRIVEVVPGEKTSAESEAEAIGILSAMGKTPIRLSRDEPGFVINRIQFALLREATALVDQGIVSAEDLDTVVRDGLARRWSKAGPFTVVAMGGPAVFERVAAQVWPHLSNATAPVDGVSRRSFEETDLGELRVSVRRELVAEIAGGASGRSGP